MLINDEIILRGEKIVFGGFTISHYNKETIFVERLLPGELARVRIKSKRAGVFYGDIVELIERSQERVSPPCEHYERCGGCSFQHLGYEAQVREKSAAFTETIERISKLSLNGIYEGVISSPFEFGYRNKMEFSLIKENGEFFPALHERARYDSFVTTKNCLLPLPEIMQVTKTICRNISSVAGFLPLYIISTRESFSTKKVIVNLVVNKNELAKLEIDRAKVEKLLAEVYNRSANENGNIASGWVTYGSGSSADGERRLIFGSDAIIERVCGKDFFIGPDSFLQVNPFAAEKLYESIIGFIGNHYGGQVLDLYSGIGVIGIIVSQRFKEVVCVELNKASYELGIKNIELNGAKNIRFICGDARLVLKRLLAQGEEFDIIIVDPPRAGMTKKTTEYIVNFEPKGIIYVSCNPSTMARDIMQLYPRYRLAKLLAVDMFPQTYHIECVGLLIKDSDGRSFYENL